MYGFVHAVQEEVVEQYAVVQEAEVHELPVTENAVVH